MTSPRGISPASSFTITASDGLSAPITQKQVQAELWEPDPTGQNYETLFTVRSSTPNIRSISITNNSTAQFADALIIDSIEFATWPAVELGDITLDGDVNLADYAKFSVCLGGPNTYDEEYFVADGDGDNDMDLADYAVFQPVYAPESNP